jgi:hypothetical protein
MLEEGRRSCLLSSSTNGGSSSSNISARTPCFFYTLFLTVTHDGREKTLRHI